VASLKQGGENKRFFFFESKHARSSFINQPESWIDHDSPASSKITKLGRGSFQTMEALGCRANSHTYYKNEERTN
jgi:hypothetical protein